jgi:hypothetical protein
VYYSYFTRILLVCTRMYLCFTRMLLARMYSCVTRMYSCVTRMYSYVLACYSYVTRMYSCGVLVTIHCGECKRRNGRAEWLRMQIFFVAIQSSWHVSAVLVFKLQNTFIFFLSAFVDSRFRITLRVNVYNVNISANIYPPLKQNAPLKSS